MGSDGRFICTASHQALAVTPGHCPLRTGGLLKDPLEHVLLSSESVSRSRESTQSWRKPKRIEDDIADKGGRNPVSFGPGPPRGHFFPEP